MEKAVILGAFHFVGFHLCTTLLETGEEVIGIPFPNVKITDLEDKKMEIGRNANFSEGSWSNLPFILDKSSDVLFIDCYLLNQKEELASNIQALWNENIVDKLKNKKVKLIYNKMDIMHVKEHLLINLHKHNINYQLIYLPTVYGPWQPSEFYFAQAMSGVEQDQLKVSREESTNDAIYIEDAIEEIMNQLKRTTDSALLFQSEIKNHWKKCEEYLGLQSYEREDAEDLDFRICTTIKLRNKNEISENLEIQKRHIKMYK